MEFHPLALGGAFSIELSPHTDERGAFTRLMCMNELLSIGHSQNFAQVNHSLTRSSGTVRGMHFQNPPRAEVKVVTCLSGKVFDVIVDLRKDSPTFLRWLGLELSEDNRRMIYIPAGFAHGFQALVDNCGLLYFHTDFYAPEAEGGIRYDDEVVEIAWPLRVSHVSPRDLSFERIQTTSFHGISL
jgi:dTDP-4-dehydrorhamnose 3,5-epimerase